MAVLPLALAVALIGSPAVNAVELVQARSQQDPVPVVSTAVPEPDSEAASAVPEPTTLLLVGFGLLGLAVSSRRWRRAITATNG